MTTSRPQSGHLASRPTARHATFGLASTIVAIPASAALASPLLAAVLTGAEFALLLTILLTAVFAPADNSERAFRLLRCITGQAEPDQPWPIPPPQQTPSARARRQIN